MEELEELKGKRLQKLINSYVEKPFGSLTILNILGTRKGRTVVKAKCQCGITKEFYLYNLLRNCTKSCGCLRTSGLTPGNIKHGEAKLGKITLEYRSFVSMKENLKKGISICPRWLDSNIGYNNFLEDMGRKPSKNYKLTRINKQEGFFKENCQWKEIKFTNKESISESAKKISEAWESGKVDKFKEAVYGQKE